jgi:hypothetical protein
LRHGSQWCLWWNECQKTGIFHSEGNFPEKKNTNSQSRQVP